MAETQSRKKELTQRLGVLKRERQPFEDYWRSLIKGLDPRKEKFLDESFGTVHGGANRGSISERHDHEILNNRIKQARRIAVSGMFAGTVSPSTPIFKLETIDTGLMTQGPVRNWLFTAEQQLLRKLNDNGFFSVVIPFIRELLDYSTAFMTDVVDGKNNPLFETHPIGTYYLAHNQRKEVDTAAIRRNMTARQMFKKYGPDNLSPAVKNALDNNNFEQTFLIVQIIEPNERYDEKAGKLDSKFKKFRATTFDPGDPSDKLLEDKGFDDFPGYGVRWEISGNETYGTNGPGMTALGDTNQLQSQEEKKARAIEMMVDPLLKGPPDLKNLNIPNNRSNGLITYDDLGGANKLEPVYQVDPRLQELQVDMQAIERRINEAYFVDLFQAISSMQGVQPRNQEEIALRNEESMLVLGPMLQNFQREFLRKLLDRNFQRMAENDEFPEPPEEIEGTELQTRFVSTLIQAQRSTEAAVLERYLQFTGAVAQFDPEVLDKLDADAAMDLRATLSGVNPVVVRDQETVEALREERQKAQQAQQAAEMQQQQASANAQNASAVQQVTKAVTEAGGGQ